jgi:hypothetical protein
MTSMKIVRSLMVLAAAMTPAAAAAQHSHDAAPAPKQAAAVAPSAELRAQIEAVRGATERYRDHANAVKDGYRLFGAEGPLMGEHWYHPDLTRRPFDVSRPSTLQYATVGGRKVLVGVAYSVYHRPEEPVPEGFAGAEDRWHTHDTARLARAFVADRRLLRWVVDRRLSRGDGKTHLSMVHAWVWSDNPDGVFAGEHRALPYLRAGLPAAWAASASRDAAHGVALLAPAACAGDVRRTDRLAALNRRQQRDLSAACERASAAVRAEMSRDRSAEVVHAAAKRAWTELDTARARILTPDQLARVERVQGSAMEPHVM